MQYIRKEGFHSTDIEREPLTKCCRILFSWPSLRDETSKMMRGVFCGCIVHACTFRISMCAHPLILTGNLIENHKKRMYKRANLEYFLESQLKVTWSTYSLPTGPRMYITPNTPCLREQNFIEVTLTKLLRIGSVGTLETSQECETALTSQY